MIVNSTERRMFGLLRSYYRCNKDPAWDSLPCYSLMTGVKSNLCATNVKVGWLNILQGELDYFDSNCVAMKFSDQICEPNENEN